MQITLNKELSERLLAVCEKNFRTPELQIQFWLRQEGETSTPTRVIVNRGRPSGAWSEEQKARQRQRMKEMWKSGKMGSRKSADNVLDAVSRGAFDD
jgi:hypothetical protein